MNTSLHLSPKWHRCVHVVAGKRNYSCILVGVVVKGYIPVHGSLNHQGLSLYSLPSLPSPRCAGEYLIFLAWPPRSPSRHTHICYRRIHSPAWKLDMRFQDRLIFQIFLLFLPLTWVVCSRPSSPCQKTCHTHTNVYTHEVYPSLGRASGAARHRCVSYYLSVDFSAWASPIIRYTLDE